MVSCWLSMCPSVRIFRMITWININGFSLNLVCALILWRSGLGLLIGEFHQFLTLSACDTSVLLFPSKSEWIFTKLGMCIYIVEICFGIANGQILSVFDSDTSVFLFQDNNLSKSQWIFMKLCWPWFNYCFSFTLAYSSISHEYIKNQQQWKNDF